MASVVYPKALIALMRIAAVWPSAQTGSIEPGIYLVEAQGTLGGEPVTYRVAKIKIVKGVTV